MVRRSARLFFLRTLVVAGAFAALVVAPASAQQLDLSKGEDAVKASRKMQCSLVDGEPVTMYWQGSAYSRVPGERDRRLFDVMGTNTRACSTVRDASGNYGYRLVSREIMLYLDPATRQVLRTWKNPWTGKDVEVVHVANDPVNSRPTFARTADGKDYTLPNVQVRDGFITQSIEVPLFYTNALGGDYQDYVGGTYQAMEVFQFFTTEKDLLDATKDRVEQMGIGWVRIAQWLPWMEMGSLAGQMIVTSTGTNLKSWDDLPAVMKAEIERAYPAYKTPPPADDARPNETSWTYFKKHIDAKRKAAAAATP